MPTWPTTIPDNFLVDGYGEQAPETWVRTQMDVGIPLTRNRSRVGVTPITAALMLTKAQLETFDQFFVGQCVDGVLRFDWTDPRTKTPKSFRFTAVPVYEPVDPNVWRARVEVEELAP